MSDAALQPAAKPSAARERLLVAASRLFYAEGINAVGVDRVITAAEVTRATFYRHFPSKQDLVVAYVRRQDAELRGRVDGAFTSTDDPDALLTAVIGGVRDEIGAEDFRGCPYINVAAEYPDAADPVRVAVEQHRRWFHETVVTLLTAARHPDPEYAAKLLVMLRDGAQVAGYLDDRAAAQATFVRAAESVVGH